MSNADLLDLNILKIIRCLEGTLSKRQLDKIRQELHRNVIMLIRLSEEHLRYARRLSGPNSWRHRISRGYYACYTASRAIRLGIDGAYSTDSSDHQKIGKLPDNFPSHASWAELFTKFRLDRNMADYDHLATVSSIEMPPHQYLKKVELFLHETRKYLHSKGIL